MRQRVRLQRSKLVPHSLSSQDGTRDVEQSSGPSSHTGTSLSQATAPAPPQTAFDFGSIAIASQEQLAGLASDPSHQQTHIVQQPTELRPQSGEALPLQRMVAIGQDLYYDDAAIKMPPGKESKKSEWKANLEHITGKTATNITGGDLANVGGIQSPVLRGAVTQKLENPTQIFNYASLYQFTNFQTDLRYGQSEDITRVLLPEDMLDEADDLARQYDVSKGCVLQALVNIGVQNPDLEDDQQDDVASWHNLYYNERNIQYDDDTATFDVYTSLGLELIMNRPTRWKDIDKSLFKPGGKYVFAMPGHNFGVEFTSGGDYRPKDEPQRRVTNYQENLLIKYIWYKPGR